MVVETVFVQLHIFTKATVQFHSFSFSYKVAYLDVLFDIATALFMELH